ncbi:MAG: class I SAM-dependent methyltransferase [Candidatus Omnitrophota bacterium]|nr:class I SAM-dependent methyltransferase [Candidatus Omnitrophota bacterium]
MVGEPVLWKMKRAFQLQFLRKQSLRKQDYLLDMGCGTLRGGIPLIQYLEEGHYYGVDVREEVLKEAVREMKEARLNHKRAHLVLLTNEADLDLKREFDVVWAFSVLIHLSDEKVSEFMKLVARHLKRGGRFFANVNETDRPMDVGEWQGFPLVARPLSFYAGEARKASLEMHDLGLLSSCGHASQDAEQDRQRMVIFEKQ